MSEHIYILAEGDLIPEAVEKGRIDFNQPPFNRSVRYNVNGTKALLEGYFNSVECKWFQQNALVFEDAEQAKTYIQQNKTEWENELNES